MRIAFTSCMSSVSFSKQPSWKEVAQRQPDVLVLLGDSAYYDADDSSMSKVQGMSADEFAQHAHRRIAGQLAQPDFLALVQQPQLSTHAIWDDHDFLWNGACGGDIAKQPQWRIYVPPSRAVFAAYRAALSARLAPGSYPKSPFAWAPDVPEPGYSAVNLPGKVMLHLTDGRSYKRRKGSLLGEAQLAALEAACDNADPDTVHLVASGVVFEARNGETWLDHRKDYERLLALAARHRILVLSGDIHDNNLATYRQSGGRALFEATASGAAICTGVTVGALQSNWGLLEIDDNAVQIEIFKSGATQYRASIDRAAWQ